MNIATAVSDGAVDFHGVPIALDYEPFQRDPFRVLFAPFPRRSAGRDPIRVELRRSDQPISTALPPDWQPTFCHGLVQGYSRRGEHILTDGQSRIDVFPELGRMSGHVFAHAKTDLSAGMQHIALSLLLRERGIFDLHAATACDGRRALALVGDSGAGKTTLLLSLIGLGCDFLGDDRLLYRTDHRGTELLAYPREFHLGAATLRSLPTHVVEPRANHALAGKYSIEPLGAWPDRFRPSWQGEVTLLLPHIEDQAESSVARATAAEAFGKLLSSSATVVVDAISNRPEQLHALKDLVDSADAYDVTLGADLLAHPIDTARRLIGALDALARTT